MDLDSVKRIKVDDGLWFSTRSNKLVFGGSFLPNNIHLTISYGLKSGLIDLHITTNNPIANRSHFPIIKMAHLDFAKFIYMLIPDLQKAIYQKSIPLDLNWVKENISDVILLKSSERPYSLIDDKDVLNLLSGLDFVKRTLLISEDDNKFQENVNSLISSKKQMLGETHIKPDEISSIGKGYGILIGKKQTFFFSTYSFDQNRDGFISESINTSISSVLINTLPEDIYSAIMLRINEGIEYLQDEGTSKKYNTTGLYLTVKSDSKVNNL